MNRANTTREKISNNTREWRYYGNDIDVLTKKLGG